MNQSRRCPLCGGKKEDGFTTFTVDLGVSVMVIRHVPALVCDQCGEEWLTDTVSSELESMVNEVRKKRPLIEMTEWNHSVLLSA